MATLNETSGVLTSPYYPRRYPSNEKCSWKIIASKGERIVLVIKDIHIRSCGSSCTCDYLEIQNGSSSDGISGRRRCGYYNDRGTVYYSATDVLRVTFVSDSVTYGRYRGFKASYIKVKYNATTTGKLLETGFKRKVKGLCVGDQVVNFQAGNAKYYCLTESPQLWHSNTLQSKATQTKMSMKCQQVTLIWCY